MPSAKSTTSAHYPASADSTPQQRIDAYINAPTMRAWRSIYQLVIPGTMRTLWQAWAAINGSAPTTGEQTCYPDAFTLRRAIAQAKSGRTPVGLAAITAANLAAPRLG